eukprot:scaffold268383_cov37-Prasinocladus_malaysianus.AAC.1
MELPTQSTLDEVQDFSPTLLELIQILLPVRYELDQCIMDIDLTTFRRLASMLDKTGTPGYTYNKFCTRVAT